jgi:hypothetical protein
MQRSIRPETPPAVLSHSLFLQMRQPYLRLPPDRRAQTLPHDRTFPDVPGKLTSVAEPFDRLCAFCGIDKATGIYHFRPPGHAEVMPRLAVPAESVSDLTDARDPPSYGWPIADRTFVQSVAVASPAIQRSLWSRQTSLPSRAPETMRNMPPNTPAGGGPPFMRRRNCSTHVPQTLPHILLKADGLSEGRSARGSFIILQVNLNRPAWLWQ